MKYTKWLFALALLLITSLPAASADAADPVARAILFYSPTCPHCHTVINEVLPPLAEKHGGQLQIAGVDVTTTDGQALYQAAVARFGITEERLGVPTLVIGETVLVGSEEIPDQLPGLIVQGLAAGGIAWPDIPGLDAAMAPDASSTSATPDATAANPGAGDATDVQPTIPTVVATPESLSDKLSRDPAGNTLAILLLIGMVGVLIFAIIRMTQAQVWTHGGAALVASAMHDWRSWAIAAFGVVGLLVSVYMAFVETTHTAAICGPVGDCNTVQQSEYASLFGWLPIGILGIVGYGAILIAWAATRWGNDGVRALAATALLGMAAFGVLFSIYLTFLEPFVIGATCIWCLTSALCMTLILVLLVATKPAHQTKGRHAVKPHGTYAKGHR